MQGEIYESPNLYSLIFPFYYNQILLMYYFYKDYL